MTLDWSEGPLAEGMRLYRSGDFFATHEAWESVWLHAPQPEKLFLQALIQTTVAMHHFSRNNLLGATRLLTAALSKLEPYAADFANIDVALLRDDIRARLHTLASDPPPVQLAPPRIQPVP
jgi:predicted metal-dependent hydrolase